VYRPRACCSALGERPQDDRVGLPPEALLVHARRTPALDHHLASYNDRFNGTTAPARAKSCMSFSLTPEGVVIPLVYGPSVDWCRNVLAAGGCTLTVGGEDLAFTAPRVVPISFVAAQLVPAKANFWRSIGIEHLLSLTRAPSGELESSAIPPAGGSDALRKAATRH
jgi:hypothetical protein